MKKSGMYGGNFLDEKPLPFGKLPDIILNILLIVVIILFALHLLYRPVVVKGHSMDDTLYDGEVVALSNVDRKFAVGDIVVVDKDSRLQDDNLIIKRVTAVGGDKIAFVYEDGIIRFYRNDWSKPVDEDYIKEDMWDIGKFSVIPISPSHSQLNDYIVEIPEGEIFVMGDNRNASSDSRMIGTVKETSVKGKMVFVISDNPFWRAVYGI